MTNNKLRITMPTYTVHEPPPRNVEAVSDPERFVFVRDGFHFWAFLLGPLWMLAHQLWLVLAGYVAVSALLIGGLHVLRAPAGAREIVMLLFALLIGLEAGTLRRFALRKWKTAGIVVGDDEEEAERRFFARWLERAPSPPALLTNPPEPAALPLVRRAGPAAQQIIGLFPDAEGSPGILR